MYAMHLPFPSFPTGQLPTIFDSPVRLAGGLPDFVRINGLADLFHIKAIGLDGRS